MSWSVEKKDYKSIKLIQSALLLKWKNEVEQNTYFVVTINLSIYCGCNIPNKLTKSTCILSDDQLNNTFKNIHFCT